MNHFSPFHEGETAVQSKAGVRAMAEKVGRMIGDEFPPVAAEWASFQRLLAVGGEAEDGRVWTTILLGAPGFLHVTPIGRLAVNKLPAPDDPVRSVIESGGLVGGIVLEPALRRRMRVNGTAQITPDGWEISPHEVYANCPKFIAQREVPSERPVVPAQTGESLTPAHQALIQTADTFFISTIHHEAGADCSHRGGPAGFVEIQGNELIWEDFAGNAMFNTFGNLELNPHCGLAFLDWQSGTQLQLTGTASLVWTGDFREVHFVVESWRES